MDEFVCTYQTLDKEQEPLFTPSGSLNYTVVRKTEVNSWNQNKGLIIPAKQCVTHE